MTVATFGTSGPAESSDSGVGTSTVPPTTSGDPDPTQGDSTTADEGASTGEPVPNPFCPGGLIAEPLVDGAAGDVSGGTFVPELGWRTSSAGDRIVWDLGVAVPAGTLSFDVSGIHAEVSGCTLGVCYYVGLFDDPTGDKFADYTGAAFIESRFHTNDQENFHDVFKLQVGIGDGEILEPLTPPMGWSPDETHSVRIDWGPDPSDPTRGRAWLYLDGEQAPLNYQAFYDTPDIGWRYLFLGSTSYQGLDWGMVDVTYRNVCLHAQ